MGLLGDPEVQGLLTSPLMRMASTMMQASGPSRTPVSVGQAMGMGLDSYAKQVAAMKAAEMEQQKLTRQFGQWDIQNDLARQKLAQGAMPKSPYAAIDVSKFTPESIRQFEVTGMRSDLVPRQDKPKLTSLMQNFLAGGGSLDTEEGKAQFMDLVNKSGININMPSLEPGMMAINPQDLREGTVPVPGGTKDPAVQDRKTYVEKSAALDSFESALTMFENAYSVSGTELAPTAKKARLEAAYNQLLTEYNKVAELGALAADDLKIIQGVLKDPTSLSENIYAVASPILGDRIGESVSLARERLTAERQKLTNRFQGGVQGPLAVPPPPPGFR